MSVEDQLRYEARVRKRQAILAIVAAVLLLVSPIIELAGLHPKVNELTLTLIAINQRFPLDLIAAFVQAAGLVALAFTLGWLGWRSQVRDQGVRAWVRWLAVTGAIVSAIGWVGSGIAAAVAAHSFVSSGAQTYVEAYNLTSSGAFAVMGLLEQLLGPVLLAAGFIFVALNAMRVGLLPRNIGFIGIAAGALVLFPILPVPIVECFWLAVLGILLAGRWPDGDPPAWKTGLAAPWVAGQRGGRAGSSAGGARGRRGQSSPQPGRQAQPEAVAEGNGASVSARTRATTPKRKRKHRS
ncbi:MAG: hypothetical protein ACLP8S_25350 [Solirubrobacteraceae bacterium]